MVAMSSTEGKIEKSRARLTDMLTRRMRTAPARFITRRKSSIAAGSGTTIITTEVMMAAGTPI